MSAHAIIPVYLVVQPNILLLDLACVAEVFRIASSQVELTGSVAPRFELHYVGVGEQAVCSVGLSLAQLAPLPQQLTAGSWVVVSGVASASSQPVALREAHLAASEAAQNVIAQWLIKSVHPQVTVITVCSGAMIAAKAGLLAGRRCTTHHEMVSRLRELSPSAQVLENRVFVENLEQGMHPLYCSAGVTTAIDLALHLVAKVCGHAVALAVARSCVVYMRRGPNDPQMSPMLAFRNHVHPAVHRAQDAVLADPQATWSAEQLAAKAHVTSRHLARLFAEHAGLSPQMYVEQIRVELARRLLAEGGESVERIATAVGFSSAQQFRRAWRKTNEAAPSAMFHVKHLQS